MRTPIYNIPAGGEGRGKEDAKAFLDAGKTRVWEFLSPIEVIIDTPVAAPDFSLLFPERDVSDYRGERFTVINYF